MNLPWTDREHKSPQNSASFNSFSREFGGIGEGGRARNVHELRARGAARKTIARKKKEKETWGEGGEDGEKERDNAKNREGEREGEREREASKLELIGGGRIGGTTNGGLPAAQAPLRRRHIDSSGKSLQNGRRRSIPSLLFVRGRLPSI